MGIILNDDLRLSDLSRLLVAESNVSGDEMSSEPIECENEDERGCLIS